MTIWDTSKDKRELMGWEKGHLPTVWRSPWGQRLVEVDRVEEAS